MPFRILSFAVLFFVLSCNAPEAPADATETTASLDSVSTKQTTPVAPEKPIPVPQAATPDRDATVTEDRPVPEPTSEPIELSEIEMPQPSARVKERPSATPAPPTQPAATTNTTSTTSAPAQPAATPAPKEASTTAVTADQALDITPAAPAFPDHSSWDKILRQYVNNDGRVNYAALKAQPARLDAYLASLAEATPTREWPRNTALAYWINTYNAYTFKLILDNYPLKSITELHGGDPWKVKWIELAGKTYSLNMIEHDIIRPRYQEPRIHFAVVCAANACPPILNRAFTADKLNRQLEQLARSFINNPQYNQTTGDIRVSRIFDWYGEDFGNLRDYLNKYLESPLPADAEIGYMDYDWSLNKQ